MPKITDTYALAYACCETILKELNRFPTIDLIRERIGVNSPNTIKQAMNDWTAAFAKQYIAQQLSERICPEVPSVLTDAVSRLWQDTVQAAAQTADEKLKKSNAIVTGLQNKIMQLQNAMQDASKILDSTNGKLATAKTQIAELTQTTQQLRADLLTAQQQAQTLGNTIKAQNLEKQALQTQNTERLQQEQAWMQRRIVEERDLAAEKWQGKQQQLEERLVFLKVQAEQAQQAQKLTQVQNQQMLDEISHLKIQKSDKTLPLLSAHRFKIQRNRP